MPRILLSKIVVTGNNPRKTFDELAIQRLGQSIKDHGQIHSVLVRPLPDENYELVTGEMRLRACMFVGLPDIEAEIRELSDLQCAEFRLIENVHRTDLTDAEKGTAFLELWNLSECETLKELAEKEQLSYNTVKTLWIPKSKKLSERVKESIACNTSDITERHTQFLMKYLYAIQDRLLDVVIKKKLTSPQLQELTRRYDENPQADLEGLADEVLGLPKTVTISVTALTEKQKRKIAEEKKQRPKAKQPKHKKRVTKTKPELQGSWKPKKFKSKADRRKELLAAIAKLPVLEGKFQVIVIDPPWAYENRVDDVSHRARSPYPQMSIAEIIAKSPPCADDCVIWLWTTNAFMHDALHVLEAWGLEAKTILTWKKSRFGLGDWLRGQTEHCILAVKGHPIVTLSNQSTFLEGDLREHSRKPDSFFKLVEELCHGSKCEMYGREEREGWTVSGLSEFK